MKIRSMGPMLCATLIMLSACGGNNTSPSNNQAAATATPLGVNTATDTPVASEATSTPTETVASTETTTDTKDANNSNSVSPITTTVPVTNGATGTGTNAEMRGVVRASELLDYGVENFKGENLGKIKDAIVALPDGCIAYMVLSFGGVLGLGDNQYLIPWRAVSINPNTSRLLLNIDQNRLTNAPVFDTNNLPDFNSPTWDDDVSAYWHDVTLLNNATSTTMTDTGALTDTTSLITSTGDITNSTMLTGSMMSNSSGDTGMMPCNINAAGASGSYHTDNTSSSTTGTTGTATTTGMTNTAGMSDTSGLTGTNGTGGEMQVAGLRALRLSDLLNYEVHNAKGDKLGSLEDIMIDWRSDRIAYPILSFGGFLGLGGKWFPIPLNAVTLDAAQQRFIFDVDEARLERAPGFSPNELPDTANPNWDEQILNYWQTH